MTDIDTSLKNFEKWLLDQNLKPNDFIVPGDRILSKIGYKGAPLIYLNFIQFMIFFFLLNGFFLPLVIGLVIGLVSKFFLKFSLTELFFVDSKISDALDYVLCILFISSLCSLFFHFKKKKLPRLPPWETFIK